MNFKITITDLNDFSIRDLAIIESIGVIKMVKNVELGPPTHFVGEWVIEKPSIIKSKKTCLLRKPLVIIACVLVLRVMVLIVLLVLDKV
jgi:hypothetical protein